MVRKPILAPRGLAPTKSDPPIEADGDRIDALAADVTELRNDVQYVVQEVVAVRREVETTSRDRREDFLDLRNDIADMREDMARAAREDQAKANAESYLQRKHSENPLADVVNWVFLVPVWALRIAVAIFIWLVAIMNESAGKWLANNLRF